MTSPCQGTSAWPRKEAFRAGLALLQLGGYRELVERLSADRRILDRLDGPPCGRFDPDFEDLAQKEGVVSMGLWDTAGGRIARWPIPNEPLRCERTFGWCDHFKGAARLAERGRREGYIGRVSRSEVTGNDKSTISAPVYGTDGRWRGVVYVSFGIRPALRDVPLHDAGDPLRTAALLARRDITRETEGDPLPSGFVVLVHDGVEQGKAWPVASSARWQST